MATDSIVKKFDNGVEFSIDDNNIITLSGNGGVVSDNFMKLVAVFAEVSNPDSDFFDKAFKETGELPHTGGMVAAAFRLEAEDRVGSHLMNAIIENYGHTIRDESSLGERIQLTSSLYEDDYTLIAEKNPMKITQEGDRTALQFFAGNFPIFYTDLIHGWSETLSDETEFANALETALQRLHNRLLETVDPAVLETIPEINDDLSQAYREICEKHGLDLG